MTKPNGELIALPFNGKYMFFEVEKLQTAMLVLMDLPQGMDSLKICAHRLRDEFGFNRKEYILHPVAAQMALDREILL